LVKRERRWWRWLGVLGLVALIAGGVALAKSIVGALNRGEWG
jgi:uncharacterized membrane protein HdeD (DUF308 family)